MRKLTKPAWAFVAFIMLINIVLGRVFWVLVS